MNNKRIQEIVDAYLPEEEFSYDARAMAKIACMNVERELRSQIGDYKGRMVDASSVPSRRYVEAPPLGLMPRQIHNDRRKQDILSAIKRYSEAGKACPLEWIEELWDLC